MNRRRITPLTPEQTEELRVRLTEMGNELAKIRTLVGNAHPLAHPTQRRAARAVMAVRDLRDALPDRTPA